MTIIKDIGPGTGRAVEDDTAATPPYGAAATPPHGVAGAVVRVASTGYARDRTGTVWTTRAGAGNNTGPEGRA
ncbi:hypothetical protein [Streptomyces plumbiresistens]|uniref:Uncharacterized protein n=1 Tax=Streptomyces plumbiresistens TaxID=511811 RepID=A0ABP7SME0_9ACTN